MYFETHIKIKKILPKKFYIVFLYLRSSTTGVKFRRLKMGLPLWETLFIFSSEKQPVLKSNAFTNMLIEKGIGWSRCRRQNESGWVFNRMQTDQYCGSRIRNSCYNSAAFNRIIETRPTVTNNSRNTTTYSTSTSECGNVINFATIAINA